LGKVCVFFGAKEDEKKEEEDKEEIMAGNIVKWWRQFKQYKQFSGKKSYILSLCAFFVIAYPKKNERNGDEMEKKKNTSKSIATHEVHQREILSCF
jgi:hypothetical protein